MASFKFDNKPMVEYCNILLIDLLICNFIQQQQIVSNTKKQVGYMK